MGASLLHAIPVLLSVLFFVGSSASASSPGMPESIQEATPGALIDARTLVIGRDPGAVDQVMADLEGLGLSVLRRNRMDQALDSVELIGDTAVLSDGLMHRAFLSGAELLVVVDVKGGLASPSVSVNAVDIEAGAMVWGGHMAHAHAVPEQDYATLVRMLAHHAVMNGLTPAHTDHETRR